MFFAIGSEWLHYVKIKKIICKCMDNLHKIVVIFIKKGYTKDNK